MSQTFSQLNSKLMKQVNLQHKIDDYAALLRNEEMKIAEQKIEKMTEENNKEKTH